MYPQVEVESSNKTLFIGLAILSCLIVLGVLLYIFVFKCKGDGVE